MIADRRLAAARQLPGPGLAARLAHDELADRDHQAGLLGDRDELRRRDQAALGVVPPDERLHRDDVAVGQADDRLVVEDELAALDRAAHVDAERQPLGRGVLHRGVEQPELVLAGLLRVIHRDVGRAEHVGRAGQAGRAVGDADAAADPDRPLGQDERRFERRQDAGGDDRGVLLVDVVEQDRELVAAEPAGRVLGADRGEQALGDHRQDRVRLDVAERVVDGLEVVEVDEQDGRAPGVPPPPAEGVLEAIDEQGPVRQVGQRIVEGQRGQRVLEGLPAGHVVDRDDEPEDRRVGGEVCDLEFDREPRAVGHAQPAIELGADTSRAIGQFEDRRGVDLRDELPEARCGQRGLARSRAAQPPPGSRSAAGRPGQG